MKELIKIVFVLIELLYSHANTIISPYSNINRRTLQDKLSVQPCFIQPDGQSQIFNLGEIFPDLKSSSKISLSGWFLLQGYNQIEHTLISLHSHNNIILQLSYIIDNNQINMCLIGNCKLLNNNSIISNQWVFIAIDIQIILPQIWSKVAIFINYIKNILNSEILPIASAFVLKELEVNIGNPPMRLNIESSCSLVKNVSVFLDSNLNLESINGVDDYISKNEPQLIYHYDLFYFVLNDQQLINDQGYLDQKISYNFFMLNPQQLNLGDQIKTNTIDLNGNSGYIISFYLKFATFPTLLSQVMSIYIDNQQINLNAQNNQFIFCSQTISVADIQQWNNFVIIVNNQDTLKIYLIIREYGQFSIECSFVNFVTQFFIAFNPDLTSYFLNHIRIYQGSALSKEGNCFYQMMNSSKPSCLVCNSNYLLDFQNNMSCVLKSSTNTDSQIQGVKDWNPVRNVCPKNMINDSASPFECKCIIGFYRQSNHCVKCPNYCLLCSSLSLCQRERNINGKCINPNYFNDGLSCFKPLFILPLQPYLIKIFDKPEFGTTCLVMDSDLSNFQFANQDINLKLSDTLFFSFSIKFTQYLTFSNVKVAYLMENSVEILSITIQEIKINGQPLFNLIFSIKNIIVKVFKIHPYDVSWIGFWTDNSKHIFLVRSNRINYFDQSGSLQLYSSLNLKLCIGRCEQVLVTGCITLNPTPFLFIKNIPYPTTEGIPDMFSLMQPDVLQIANFKFTTKQIGFRNALSNLISPYSGTDLVFGQPLESYSEQQGFGLSQNVNARPHLTVGNFYGILSFSCNIEFGSTQQVTDSLFLHIQFKDGSYFKVFLVMDYTLEVVRIRICLMSQCYITKYSFLNLYNSNFLFISVKFLKYWERMVLDQIFRIEVVCNYLREQLSFEGAVLQEQIIDFGIGDTALSHLYYIDNLNIFEQYGFTYFDYINTNPCFLYINKKEMKCLHLKEDYLYFNNTIITKSECQNMYKITQQTYVINRKDQTCDLLKNMGQDDSLCGVGNYDGKDFKCVVCKDVNADPLNKCKTCKSHYFYDTLTSSCRICDPTCIDCINNSSNCIDCININLSPPSCKCMFSGTFLDSNLTCQQCSYQCASCIDNQDQCLTCSEITRELPLCNCNDQYIEINNKCQQIQCDQRCANCSTTSTNCTVCSINRTNPPNCKCQDGYVENTYGECVQCNQFTYFDQVTKQCLDCPRYCLECDKDQCFNCIKGSDNLQMGCSCPPNQSFYLVQTDEGICLKNMDVDVSVILLDNEYFLKFIFDKDLKQIDFSKTPIEEIIYLYIPEVKSELYSLTNPIIIRNVFQLKIKVLNNFQTNKGFFMFLNNQQFISTTYSDILSETYIKKQIEFKLGPFLIKKEDMVAPGLDDINNKINEFKSQNTDLFEFMRQIQFVFYLLNTLQPTSVFLLVNAVYPPNLYKFYQFVGVFVFPFVPDYQSTNFKTSFSLFGYSLDTIDSKQPQQSIGKFSKLGYCLSLIINIPIIVIKYIFLLLVLLSTQVILNLTNSQKRNYLLKVKMFLIKRINQENEINLTSAIICIIIQFSTIQEQSYFFRIGFYFSLILISQIIIMFNFNLKNIYSSSHVRNEYSLIFLERMPTKNSTFNKCYFLIQLAKKYAYILVVCSFYNNSILICSLCGLLFLLSSALTLYMNPYHNQLSRSIKFLGDLILSNVWFLHIGIISIESKLLSQPEIDNNLFQKYLKFGQVILILLLIFNFIFFIQFLSDVYYSLKKLISNDKVNQSNQNIDKQLNKKKQLLKI